jgi:hypothetical protein
MNNIDKLIEEISIKGGGILQSIRQPSNNDLTEGDLVFIYPIIMDATLDKNYGGLVRDFVTVSFVNRIKQTNVLNVISDATSPGTVKSGNQEINPAQMLKKHLGRSPVDSMDPNDALTPLQNGNNYSSNQDYNDALVELRKYVKNQIDNNPEYKNLRPIISEVMASNLIPIPLIIGTNQMKINNNVLYWILFIAAGQHLPLDRASSLDKIKRFLRQIDTEKYNEFMTGLEVKEILDSPRKMEQIINSIWDGTDRATSKFHLVLDEGKWNREVGVNSHTAKLTTAIHNTNTSQGAMARRASTAFKNFVGNEVVGILQSITHAIVPETEIDISSKLTKFVDSSTNVRAHYETIYDYIIGSSSNIDEVDELIKVASNICKENSEINVNKIFSQLSSLHFGMTGKKRTSGGFLSKFSVADNSGELLAEFTEDLVGTGATLASFSKSIEEYIVELGGVQALDELSKYKEKYKKDITNYFQGGWDTDEGGITASTYDPLADPLTPDPNFRGTPGLGERGLFNSKRFQHITGGVGKADQQAFENNVYNSLTEIVHFLSIFNFMSFFCDYLREIETEVSVQKRDAVNFPNYVLVTRIEYITRIFWALATTNFENEMTEEKEKEQEHIDKEKLAGIFNKQWKLNIPSSMNKLKKLNPLQNPFGSWKLSIKKQQQVVQAKIDELERMQEASGTSFSQKREMQSDIDSLKLFLTQKTPHKGKAVDQFRISSMNDVTKQINLIKERLKIPNIVVIDEKNKKIFYKLMFHQRVMNLDMGTMNTYISQQKKDMTNGFNDQ